MTTCAEVTSPAVVCTTTPSLIVAEVAEVAEAAEVEAETATRRTRRCVSRHRLPTSIAATFLSRTSESWEVILTGLTAITTASDVKPER